MNELILGATTWLDKRLEQISSIKNKVIIFSGLVYLFGYVVWSVYAWSNNLGVLPAIQVQYFFAGLVPVVVLLITWGIVTLINWFLQKKWPSLVGPEVTGWKSILRLLIGILFLPSFLMMIVQVFWHPPEAVSTIMTYIFVISFILLPPDILKDNKIFQILQTFYRFFIFGLLPILLSLLILTYFWFRIYPTWPQELGGVKPRCAYLDVDTASLSPETIEAILPPSTSSSEGGAVRSIQVDVYYSSGSTFLIKPHQQPGKNRATYEVNKSHINAIEWCLSK